jgi:hypothetical protein
MRAKETEVFVRGGFFDQKLQVIPEFFSGGRKQR